MPSTWKRGPEALRKAYISNTEAFYKAAGRSFARRVDEFMRETACGLWQCSGGVTQSHVEAYNALASKDEQTPAVMLWELTAKICEKREFLPPLFFWTLAESDKKRGATASRLFVRAMTNILLTLAAVDDDVSMAEASYITDCADKLSAICDSAGVKKDKAGLDPMSYVTSGEPSFTEKHPVSASGAAAPGRDAARTPESAAQTEQKSEKSFEELMEELDSLVGLEEVKKEVRSLVNLMKVRKLRTEAELPVPPMSLHLVFLGNPGTGKTTVARLLAGLYASVGVLSKGQLVEVDRSGLVAGYVGQTALKTQEVIQSALGGVLFIDEAYSLANGGENDFGREATEILLKAMEDHRDDLVVIVAGYDEPMEKFISSNPGLESRFNKYIYFPDYNGEQLFQMFEMRCKKNGYVPTPEAAERARALFNDLYENRDENFGNGRDVRNRFEDMISRQANRVAAMESPTREDLMALLPEDVFESEEDEKPAEDTGTGDGAEHG